MLFMILYDTSIIYLYIHVSTLNFCALLFLQLMLGKGRIIFQASAFYCLRKCLRSRIDFGAFRNTETVERLIFSNARV